MGKKVRYRKVLIRPGALSIFPLKVSARRDIASNVIKEIPVGTIKAGAAVSEPVMELIILIIKTVYFNMTRGTAVINTEIDSVVRFLNLLTSRVSR